MKGLCPKCGGGPIFGPTSVAMGFDGEEALQYNCGRCGYLEQQPCKDSKREEKQRLMEILSETPK